jgi:hypothetical protein
MGTSVKGIMAVPHDQHTVVITVVGSVMVQMGPYGTFLRFLTLMRILTINDQ